MSYTTALLYGSVRTERQGILAARYLNEQLRQRSHTVHFIDVKEYPLPFLDKMYKGYPTGQAPENMERIANLLKEAEGFVIVTGEYNHSIPPALKNLLDHFQQEYFYKPSAIACYSAGRFGGVRSAVHLRAVLAELGMSSIPTMLPFPKVQKAFDEQYHPLDEYTNLATSRFLDEYEWYVEALKTQREKRLPR